jgi:ubiquinone/menaquinone biosynthesis C-methylase UbiE
MMVINLQSIRSAAKVFGFSGPGFRGGKSLAGHLEELRIAFDPAHRGHVNPDIRGCERVLDVGCGAGQTLISAYAETPAVGVDLDFTALQLAKSLSKNAMFACAAAECLPFADSSFDLVVSRVALPYTRISSSLAEIHRVLRSGGRLWAVLHPISVPWREAVGGNIKSYIYFIYVLLNGLLFHFGQVQVGFLGQGYESFQTRRGMQRALVSTLFEEISFRTGTPFVVNARRR